MGKIVGRKSEMRIVENRIQVLGQEYRRILDCPAKVDVEMGNTYDGDQIRRMRDIEKQFDSLRKRLGEKGKYYKPSRR